MGFGGIHIKGHSGTDFKHKKFFSNVQKRSTDIKGYARNVKTEYREVIPEYKLYNYIKAGIIIGALGVFILLISSYVLRVDNLVS